MWAMWKRRACEKLIYVKCIRAFFIASEKMKSDTRLHVDTVDECMRRLRRIELFISKRNNRIRMIFCLRKWKWSENRMDLSADTNCLFHCFPFNFKCIIREKCLVTHSVGAAHENSFEMAVFVILISLNFDARGTLSIAMQNTHFSATINWMWVLSTKNLWFMHVDVVWIMRNAEYAACFQWHSILNFCWAMIFFFVREPVRSAHVISIRICRLS